MSKKKNPKGGVAQSVGTPYKMTKANFRIFVKLYVIAKMLNAQFIKMGLLPPAEYFRGVVKGYEDSFTLMELDDEKVNSVLRELNPDSVEKEAKDIFTQIMEKSRAPKIIVGDKVTEVKAAKEVFDQYLGRFKK